MKAPDLCCHFTLNIIPDRCSPQHFLPLRALRNRLPHADRQALIIASLQQQTKLLNLYSPLDFIILLLHLPSPHSPRRLGHVTAADLLALCGKIYSRMQPSVM